MSLQDYTSEHVDTAKTRLSLAGLTMMNKRLKEDYFPEIDESSLPECAESSCSDSTAEEDSKQQQFDKYSSKEDQDVAVFMEIAKRLPIKSLIHLLGAQARTQAVPAAFLDAAPPNHTPLILPSPDVQQQAEKRQKIVKQFRFAEAAGRQVRTVVHTVSRHEDPRLWWSDEEMNQIRSEAIQAVRFFRDHRPEYAQSVLILGQSYKPEIKPQVVEDHLKKVSDETHARGLEVHIVEVLRVLRAQTIKAIIREQERIRRTQSDQRFSSTYTAPISPDEAANRLRQISLISSEPNGALALKLAQADQIMALKAILSSWTPTNKRPAPSCVYVD